ncbi:MAG: hypothetical protein CNLJKLNK_01318 [Holosporales bacterium]
MESPDASLGTVWVKEFDSKLKDYHLLMAKKELTDSCGTGIQTNIAMFGLNIRMKDLFLSNEFNKKKF